jgi:deoxyribose-phosphate aldolase
MRASVSPDVGVKAAGGVRSLGAALEVITVGVTRIGATRTEGILESSKQGFKPGWGELIFHTA